MKTKERKWEIWPATPWDCQLFDPKDYVLFTLVSLQSTNFLLIIEWVEKWMDKLVNWGDPMILKPDIIKIPSPVMAAKKKLGD